MDEHPDVYQHNYQCSVCRRWLWSDIRKDLRTFEIDEKGDYVCHDCVDDLMDIINPELEEQDGNL